MTHPIDATGAAAGATSVDQLFRSVGAALFRRSARVFGDDARAAAAAEALFVRFVVHRRGGATDARARRAWIYRVATNHALQRLPDDARPGGAAPSPPARAPVPTMRALRRLDEATRNIVVLARLDGLPPEEIAEVIGSTVATVERKLAAAASALADAATAPAAEADAIDATVAPPVIGAAAVADASAMTGAAPAAGAAAPASHPSWFALELDAGDGASTGAHVAGCARCRDDVEAGARVTERFARSLDGPTLARVAAAVRAERARQASGPGWKRALVLVGALALITIFAFVVARPRALVPERTPFRGLVTASRAKAAGIRITVRRGVEIQALAPGAALEAGDRLHFRVRAEGPRYLEIHVRGPAGETRVFPADGNQAVRVDPGQSVDHDYLVEGPNAAAGSKLWIIASFAEHPFALDVPPAPDVEVVPVRVDVAR